MAEPDPNFDEAVTLHRQDRLAEAERGYRQTLLRQPDHFDAMHLLGVVALQTQRARQSVELIRQAILLNGQVADAHYHLGHALRQLGQLDAAAASYRTAIALQPRHVEAHYHLGNTLHQMQRPTEAIASFDQAVALRPDHVAAHNSRGFALQGLNRPEDAIGSYDRAIALKSDIAATFYNRALALQHLGRFQAALASYDRAISLKPDFAEAINNRGTVLLKLGRADAALASCERAIALQPDYAEAHINRGSVLQNLARFDAALTCYDHAAALQPDSVDVHNNRGNVLHALCRHDEALHAYQQAIALRPEYPQAHFGNGLCLLHIGDLARGWPEYEWRWQAPELAPVVREFERPLWLGQEPLAGKTVLLHAEQGYGDTLQFCRYALEVKAHGADVVLEVPQPLVRLMASLRIGTVVATGDPLPAFDLHCPLMSLPLAFGTTLATIPAPMRYLATEPQEAEAWRERLAGLPGRRVGLVWAGDSRRHSPDAMAVDRRRSITLAHLAPLATVPGISFVSLQKGEPAAQTLAPPPGMVVHDVTYELRDFAATAALIETLDLVISVDTAVAHLAGALGKPVWILNRFDACWRWLLDRNDSPWYPTARLFRQPAQGDWDSVITAVREALSTDTDRIPASNGQ